MTARASRVAALLVALPAAAAAAAHPSAEIVEYGRTAGARAPATRPDEAGSGLAPARSVSHVRFLDHSEAIEAHLCASFGIRLRIAPGDGEAEPEAVEVRVLHPRFTAPDGRTSAEDDFRSAVVFGQTHVGFTFDHAWELVPGTWTLAVSARGVPLAVKRFTVTLPPAGTPTTECGETS